MSRVYAFATGAGLFTTHWKQERAASWEDFVDWMGLSEPADKKVCGGYVAAELQETTGHKDDPNCVGLHRNKRAVVTRSMLTLDVDKASLSFVADTVMDLSATAMAMYTTWSHQPDAPRWRLLIPLSEDVKAEDYRLLADVLMDELGSEQFDKGSREPERLMHRPSTQGSYSAHVFAGEPLDVQAWLEVGRKRSFEKPEKDERPAFECIYDDLSYDEQQESDAYVADTCEHWRRTYAVALDWGEGVRDSKGRGWEKLALDGAWALAQLAVAPWTSIDETGAELAYREILPAEIARAWPDKWRGDTPAKAAASGDPAQPPWLGRSSAFDDFSTVLRIMPPCDHSNEAHVTRWLLHQIGTGPLTGLFRRGSEDLIYTPRVGEEGYTPPDNPEDHDGPAQVRRMNPLRLASRVDASYRVFRQTKKTKTELSVKVDMVFKRDLAERALADLDRCTNLRRVRMVSHTPLVRADGTVLDQPGYDDSSGVLYLPESGLEMQPVPEQPSERNIAAARELLLALVVDFPFVTDHDRANYLGCLMLPLLRLIVPPPYQMLIIGAPQRGSGKSLLAYILRTIHGGVFRSEIPREEDERRKVITSILDGTSAPVVQFDNVTGALKSSTLDGLLTNATWSDRRLGGNENVIVPNDRLWVVTGNNVHIGGDMDRRVLWSTIDANLEHPELRPPTTFHHSDLEGYVRRERGAIIHAMLVLARGWAVAGSPSEEAPTSDSFGKMQQVLRGVLSCAEIPGVVAHQESKPDRPDFEAEEWATFLRAAQRAMGDTSWTTRELLGAISEFAEGDELRPDELPGDLADKVRHNPHGAAKSLGKLISSRRGRWTDGLKIDSASGGGKSAVKWHVTDHL